MSRGSWLRLGAPVLVVGLAAVAIAVGSSMLGETRTERADDAVSVAAELDAGHAPDGSSATDAAPEAPDAAWRYDSRGRLVRPPAEDDYRCQPPAVEVERSEGCDDGGVYPACRWRLPDPEDESYVIWRNTVPEHRWARPGLVSLVLAVAAEYHRRWPGEHLTVGDLDAPGPRHQTHDRGVDVDLYLEQAMIARNEGGRRYPDNYENRSRREVRSLRARCMDLAKIIATCAAGQIRIYYNDPDLIRPFRAWFEEQGMRSDVGRPMRQHNDLHRFHFHLTVADDIEPLTLD